jgi:hypothetical protein
MHFDKWLRQTTPTKRTVMSNKTATPLGTVKLREGDFREVMDPLLDIFEYHKVLVPDAAGIYVFDTVKLRACRPTAYRNLINGLFRAPGGNFIGFSNLGVEDEKLSSPYRNFSSLPESTLGSLTSAHTGIERTPTRGGNADEHLTRVTMICDLAAGRSRDDAVNVICEFLARCSWRSRVLAKKKKISSGATQVNAVDDVVGKSKDDVRDKIRDEIMHTAGLKKTKATDQAKALLDFPACALSKMINIIALGREHEITLYENKQTSTPSPVSLIDFIGRTDGEDRREYSRLTGGVEWPFLTKDDIDKILLHYSSLFPDTVNQHVTAQLRAALGA